MSYSEDEAYEMMQLKQDSSYHFSIPFEYVVRTSEDDDVEYRSGTMEVDVVWDDVALGYKMSYFSPDYEDVALTQGADGVDEIFENDVEFTVREELGELGVGAEAICV